jgi:hypothetical protein
MMAADGTSSAKTERQRRHRALALVYCHTPRNICINSLLENEEFLRLAAAESRRATGVDEPPAIASSHE